AIPARLRPPAAPEDRSRSRHAAPRADRARRRLPARLGERGGPCSPSVPAPPAGRGQEVGRKTETGERGAGSNPRLRRSLACPRAAPDRRPPAEGRPQPKSGKSPPRSLRAAPNARRRPLEPGTLIDWVVAARRGMPNRFDLKIQPVGGPLPDE